METRREDGTRREDTQDGATRREPSPDIGAGTRRDEGSARREDGGTRREDGGTRREDGSSDIPRPRAEAGTGQYGVFTRGLPGELAARFRVAEELAAGAEADVVVADEICSDRRLVLKLYRRGVRPDEEAIGRLATADHAHVVEVVDSGWAGGCWFEVLEHCPHGSLRTLMASGSPPGVIDVVRETSTALAHVHELGLVHRDLKPENILVRTVEPLDLVLGDFGLVRAMEASVRWTRAWGTPAYSPPEFEGGEVSAAWDWWALGMIVAELAGGQHPFELPDGSMMNDQQMRAALAQRAVDLSAVGDARVALLCRGLLTRDRLHRWGREQVGDWLAGRSPAVVADAVEPVGRTRTVLFADQEFDTPAALAAVLQQHWVEGSRKLYQERDATLLEELERLLRQHHLDEAARLLAPATGGKDEAQRRYASLLAEMDADLEPVYNGVWLTPRGLEDATGQIIASAGQNTVAEVLDQVRRLDILTLWRALPGMQRGPEIEHAWTEAIAKLTSGVNDLRAHGYQATDAELRYAGAWLLRCILEPGHHGAELTSLVENLDSRAADRQAWWHDLRYAAPPTPLSQVLVRLTHSCAVEQTHRQDEAERERQRADREREAAAEAARKRERQAERDRQLTALKRTDNGLIKFAIFLIVTVGAPYGLGVLWDKKLSNPAVAPPPDLKAVPGGSHFVPELVFGALVILGLLGLTFLRPPWLAGRVPRMLVGLVLVAAGLTASLSANQALTEFNRAGQHAYATGPIPVAQLGGSCGTYWTSDLPLGSGYMRWVLTGSGSNGCGTLAAYHGWQESWQVTLGSHSWWQNLHMYGNIAVAEKDVQGRPNVLVGFRSRGGKRKWTFSCRDGNASYLTNTTYGPTFVTVSCARGRVKVNPRTGRQVR